VSDPADDAPPEQPGRARRRLQTSRLVQYLLLQALIAAACIFALRQSLPEPPGQYLVATFDLSERGVQGVVTPPYFSTLRHAMDDPRASPDNSTGRPVKPDTPGRYFCRASPMASRLPSTAS
jgi:hypothetical protein